MSNERSGRASAAVTHVLALSDEEVAEAVDDIVERFGGRHRDLDALSERHAERIANRLPAGTTLSRARRRLIGATFTQEFALEAVAVCNPSAVLAPDQTGLAAGSRRAVLSVRQIGEGHRSSIGFRTIVIDADGDVSVAPRAAFASCGELAEFPMDAAMFVDLAADAATDSVRWVLDGLGGHFTGGELAARLSQLASFDDTRRQTADTTRRMTERAARCYAIEFPPDSELTDRVLTPVSAAESGGLEDARFVRVTENGAVAYHAPYTAYDGSRIVQQLLTTTDFQRFTSVPLLGAGAANKGLALFPRRIRGRYVALSRHDGQRNAVAVSDSLTWWPDATALDVTDQTWSTVQLGNCGSPIELEEGWLVLTHGVGPMRTYSIGALLLDLDDPRVILGQTERPLITPTSDDRDGYVPNVVYSCGGLRHGDNVVVPLGIADRRIGFATLHLPAVLDLMRRR